ncbi:MAG: hypothetical protein GF364_02570 [Candidatus Lokiarchaeota archaeon]|nr:hypothetical protein [Candidatus Lokiarchaeota archaeon]
MEPIIIILIIFVLISSILFPPVMVLYAFIALYPIGLIIKHKTGDFHPHWTFGGDQTTQIYVYFRSQNSITCRLTYKKTDSIENKDRWNSIDEIDFLVSDYNTPKVKTDKHGEYIPKSRSESSEKHIFFIDNLDPGAEYEYKISDAANETQITSGIFYTQELVPETNFKFAVFGDLQIAENLEIIESYLLYLMRKNNPELILSLGDNVHKGTDINSWRIHSVILRKLLASRPFYTTPGNHDYSDDYGYTMANEALMLPITKTDRWFYSVRYNRVYFISLLTRMLSNEVLQQKQQDFLEKELRTANALINDDKVDWIIIFTHVPWWGPPYNRHKVIDEQEQFIREHWVPLFEKYDVDLHFAGHKHSYCRDKNKIITGSMHGVRNYPEVTKENYFLRNSHQFCLIHVSKNQLKIEVKTWLNRNIEVVKFQRKEIK